MAAIIDVAMKRLFPEDYIAAHREIVAQRRNALLKTNPEFFAEACLALASLDLSAGVPNIRNPSLVVVGELDAATPPEMARSLAKALHKAELIEMPGCGHAPMAQQPEAFVKTISGFLELN
jgi:3-oxoadipate enol-lactonase